jgi:hypothetical protein
MAYILKSLKKINFKKSKYKSKNQNNDNFFILILILCLIVIAVDYALVLKFIDMIKNI